MSGQTIGESTLPAKDVSRSSIRKYYLLPAHKALEVGKPRASTACRIPIFIHALFRTGSTYVWNKFRTDGSYYCYCEPFHEYLLEYHPEEAEADFRDVPKTLSHPLLNRQYFYEFPVRATRGVPYFKKDFSYDDYVLREDQKRPKLRRYIRNLLRTAPSRPVLQFCRSVLRGRWLKYNFESLNIYVVRRARAQWESYLSFRPRPYYNVVTLLIAGKNSSSPLIRPLHGTIHIPKCDEDRTRVEISRYARLAKNYSIREHYFIFYYLWLLSLLEMTQVCDLIIDIDRVSLSVEARKRVEKALRTYSIDLDLRDCRIKRYRSWTLPGDEMSAVEKDVERLIARRLARHFAGFLSDLERHAPFLSLPHRRLMKSLWA